MTLEAVIASAVRAELATFREELRAELRQALEERVEGRVLDVPAIAKKLGKSTDAARMWLGRRKGEIQILNLGGRDGVRADDLERYLATPRAKRKGGSR